MSSPRWLMVIISCFLSPSGHCRRRADDAGMSTAEYAVGTVAAVAFAVVLYKIVRSPAVSSALSSIVNHALHAL